MWMCKSGANMSSRFHIISRSPVFWSLQYAQCYLPNSSLFPFLLLTCFYGIKSFRKDYLLVMSDIFLKNETTSRWIVFMWCLLTGVQRKQFIFLNWGVGKTWSSFTQMSEEYQGFKRLVHNPHTLGRHSGKIAVLAVQFWVSLSPHTKPDTATR